MVVWARDVRWIVKTRCFVGQNARWSVQTHGFVDPDREANMAENRFRDFVWILTKKPTLRESMVLWARTQVGAHGFVVQEVQPTLTKGRVDFVWILTKTPTWRTKKGFGVPKPTPPREI